MQQDQAPATGGGRGRARRLPNVHVRDARSIDGGRARRDSTARSRQEGPDLHHHLPDRKRPRRGRPEGQERCHPSTRCGRYGESGVPQVHPEPHQGQRPGQGRQPGHPAPLGLAVWPFQCGAVAGGSGQRFHRQCSQQWHNPHPSGCGQELSRHSALADWPCLPQPP